MDLIEINNEFDGLCGFLWARREYLDPFEHVMKPVPDEHYHQSLVAMTAKAKNGLVVDGICFLLSDKCLSFRKHLESSGIPVPAPDNIEEVGVYCIADDSKIQFKVPA